MCGRFISCAHSLVAVAAVACCGANSGAAPSEVPPTLKVRFFWVRHGQSCANVMDRCAVKPPESNELLPDVERALRELPRFRDAALSRSFGVKAATPKEADCTVEVVNTTLKAGETGEEGAIIRAHDAYLDPALTDCSRQQSIKAGRSFLAWLKKSGIRLDFVGSSFLMRAFETSCAMFLEPCSEEPALCKAALSPGAQQVTPVPYMTERAPRGLTSAQADNTPRSVEEQSRMIEATYGRALPIDVTFAKSWPRFAQQFEKFKAFLAVVLVPALRGGSITSPAWKEASSFQAALEAALPETMRHEDHGKVRVDVSWDGGRYSTGPEFTKREWTTLEAPEVNIAVVGHNQMMMEYCQKGEKPKPNNNAVLEKLFILNSANGATTLRELAGKCAKVMDAPDGKASMGLLTKADVDTCRSSFEVGKFLGLADSPAEGSTPCMALAEAKGAFAIQPDFLTLRTVQSAEL